MKALQVTIRPAVQADIDAMVQLLQELFALEEDFRPDPARQQKGLKLLLDGCGKHRCLLVAETEGRVIAMASVQVLSSTAEGGLAGLVEDVVVHRRHRDRGVGRQLMAAICAWADRHGLTRLQLLADRNNRPALDFYAALGWRQTQLICLRCSRNKNNLAPLKSIQLEPT
jgi:GNAT superfamily N-acetyltransferase